MMGPSDHARLVDAGWAYRHDGWIYYRDPATVQWHSREEALRILEAQKQESRQQEAGGEGDQTMKSAWTPPAAAVEPANHFHTLYMRLATISDALMREAGSREEILKNPAFGELVGVIAEMSQLSGRMTARLEGIRRDFPALWEVWQRAVAYEPTKEEIEAEQ